MYEETFVLVILCIFHPGGRESGQKHTKNRAGAGCLCLFTAIPIASDRQAVAQGAQSDSNKSTLQPIYKQVSLTTTKKCGAAREEERRTAFGNR